MRYYFRISGAGDRLSVDAGRTPQSEVGTFHMRRAGDSDGESTETAGATPTHMHPITEPVTYKLHSHWLTADATFANTHSICATTQRHSHSEDRIVYSARVEHAG